MGAVAKYLSLAGAAGPDWASTAELDEASLERRLMGGGAALSRAVEPDYARAHIELRRKGVTLMLLWAEYRAAHQGQRTWAYTQFCGHYKAFAKTLKCSMRRQRRAGEKLFTWLVSFRPASASSTSESMAVSLPLRPDPPRSRPVPFRA